ncbi:MAG: Ppx/GppA family phosphatase [Bacillota bacterium]
MSKIAVIDIGTNSTRLLVAGIDQGKIIPFYTDLITTRLGQGIEGGVLLPEAIARTSEAIAKLKNKALEWNVSSIVAVGTSAVRDAANKELFLDEVYKKAGLSVRVLSGKEEAFYSYTGVSGEFGKLDSALIVDIGGGSTEFTWKEQDKIICRSVNAGAVRMTEGGHGDRKIIEIMKKTLDEINICRPETLIGVGGTVTTLAAMEMSLDSYDRSLVHGYRLSLSSVSGHLEKLVNTGPEDRKNIPGLQPARADVIVAGVRILMLVMTALRYDKVIVSEADLMYGLAFEKIKIVDKNITTHNQN